MDYENTPEGALVRRAQAGDESTQEIVERYQSKVFSIIHGIVRQRNDGSDIAQQVSPRSTSPCGISISAAPSSLRSQKRQNNECFDYPRSANRKLVYESDMSVMKFAAWRTGNRQRMPKLKADTAFARRDLRSQTSNAFLAKSDRHFSSPEVEKHWLKRWLAVSR